MSHSSGYRTASLVAAAALVMSVITAAPAAAATDTWHSNDDIYHYFKVPQSQASSIVGGTPATLELEANIGPSGTWSTVALDLNGSDHTANVGPLEPGLYYYQYTATMQDRSKVSFRQPGSPVAVTSKPSWNTFFVPGESVAWMGDIAAGGTVAELSYTSTAAEGRTALVWTPPGYNSARAEAYPVLYLLSSKGQTAREWLELGRTKQILDNLVAGGNAKPMVVVMADANSADPRAELLNAIVPAARARYNISSRPNSQALAGVATGAEQAISILRSDPGAFAYVGSFSGAVDGSIARAEAKAINKGTKLLRVYVGNTLDPSYNDNYNLLVDLKKSGVKFEFDGVNPDDGATWDAWRENLRDFASRLFGQKVACHGASRGHRPLTQPYKPPAAGSITTPRIGSDGIVTFETGTQWAGA